MVWVLVSGIKGLELDSRPLHFQITTLGKLFTHVCLCYRAVGTIKWYKSNDGDDLWMER